MKYISNICIVILCALISTTVYAHNITHVVVLMLENRSFDHLLGFNMRNNPNITGLTGKEFNPLNTSIPDAARIYVSDDAPYVNPNPGHGIQDTTEQLFGLSQVSPYPTMMGFVENAAVTWKSNGSQVMSCFAPEHVPVISTLANEFALFDHYFSSVPGPTYVNRMYLSSATSAGMGWNDNTKLIDGFDLKTIYEQCSDHGVSWKIYFEEIPLQLAYKYIRNPINWSKLNFYSQFAADIKAGTLPQFSVIEPRYFELPGFPANDQHPSHSVADGEALIKEVYETLRNSSLWNNTLLLITYDEHGGFPDFVPPPSQDIPSPDGINSTAPQFGFDRLGVRVPFIAISPWLDAQVIHEPSAQQKPFPSSQFDHTSIMATVRKIFGINETLNARDAWAATFEDLLNVRSEPRTDCSSSLPEAHPLLFRVATGLNPITDLQREELMPLALSLNADAVPGTPAANVLLDSFQVESQAGLWTKNRVSTYLQKMKVSHEKILAAQDSVESK